MPSRSWGMDASSTQPRRTGWLDPRGRRIGGIAFLVTRLTGLAVLGYLYLHLVALSLLARGPAAWDAFVALASSPPVLVLDVLLVTAILLHALTGVRMALVGAGLLPAPPLDDPRLAARAPDSAWTWQVVSGALVLVLVPAHLVAQHLLVPGGLRDFEAVLAWLRSPVVVAMELLFLATVSWHGLLGLRAVLLDAGFAARTERRITRALGIVWILTVGYGLWLTSVIVGHT